MGMCGMLKVLSESELEQVVKTRNGVEDVLFPDDVANPFEGQFDLDKCWHELHFLLTGKLEPDGTILGDAVLGGEEVGTELGYGRARLVRSDRAKEIFNSLKDNEFRDLLKAINRAAPEIEEVYAGSGLRGDASYLERPFRVLLDAYRTASFRDAALLSYLT